MRATVNQKLYFARLTLDQATQVDTGEAAHTALLQASVFHLASAYRCYLREVASNNRFSIETDTADAALSQLSDQVVPEFSELAALERGDTWLARLLRVYREISEPVPINAAVSATQIPLVNITESITASACRDWLEALRNVVQQQRGQSQEW